MKKPKKRYFTIVSKKEWPDPCCWRELNNNRKEDGGFIDGKQYYCVECGNKMIAEKSNIPKKPGEK